MNYRMVVNEKVFEIIRNSDNKIIYKFNIYLGFGMELGFSCFKKIGEYEYFFSSMDYDNKIVLNCDLLKISTFKTEFIWSGINSFSSEKKYVVMDGCIWDSPDETRIYDISDLDNGVKEILNSNNFICIKIFNFLT
jgi:hypothetical protein